MHNPHDNKEVLWSAFQHFRCEIVSPIKIITFFYWKTQIYNNKKIKDHTASNTATPSMPIFPLGVRPSPPISPAHKSLWNVTREETRTWYCNNYTFRWLNILEVRNAENSQNKDSLNFLSFYNHIDYCYKDFLQKPPLQGRFDSRLS